MSTRATVYIKWTDWEQDIKLYHHRDWYVEYLGVKLEQALEKWRKNLNRAMKNCHFGSNKTLIQCVADIGWFEQAYPLHWDVEYVYQINYWIVDKKARYDLRCKSWNMYWEENRLANPNRVLLCSNWDKSRRKLNWKQAEIDLWNKDKFNAWYLD